MATRRPRKPLKIPTSASESRRTNALLEELGKEFRTFGEGLTFVRNRLNSTFDQVGRNTDTLEEVKNRLTALESRTGKVEERLSALEERVTKIEERVTKIEERVTKIEERLSAIENDLAELKKDVKDLKDRLHAAEVKLSS